MIVDSIIVYRKFLNNLEILLEFDLHVNLMFTSDYLFYLVTWCVTFQRYLITTISTIIIVTTIEMPCDVLFNNSPLVS